MRVTLEQQTIAKYLNLDLSRPKTWPMDIVNKLVPILNRHGIDGVKYEIRQLLGE